MATNILDLMQGVQGSIDRGFEKGQQRGLAGIISQSMNAPREQRGQALSRVAATSPQAAFDMQKYFEGQDDGTRQEMARQLAFFDALPDEQKPAEYPKLAMGMQQLGFPAPLQWNPVMAPKIKQFTLALGGGSGPAANTVQSQRVGEDGFIYTTMRDGTMVNTGIKADRQMWMRDFPGMAPELVGKDGQVRPVGGQAPQAPQGGDVFAGLEQIPGLQTTSGQRSPEHNREVGGVPNSYHLTGQARDIAPPNAQQAPMVRAWAAQNGMEIIDEGDHWHLEPRGNAPHVAQGGGAQARPSEATTAAQVEDAKQAAQTAWLAEQERIKAEAAVKKAKEEAEAKAQTDRDAIAATKAIDAKRTLDLLAQARKLLLDSTGSVAGSAVDQIAAVAGKSTKGAKAIAGLQTIAGLLTSSMPRMQGPQSDKDVLLYKQMAGDLANPKIPVETRMAALEQIEALNKKYAGQNRSAPSSPTRRATNAKTGEVLILVNNQWVPER